MGRIPDRGGFFYHQEDKEGSGSTAPKAKECPTSNVTVGGKERTKNKRGASERGRPF